MLDNYHTGAYGQVHQLKWSCCGAANRDSSGCQQTSTNSRQLRRKTISSVPDSRSSSKIVARRRCTSLRGRNSKRQQQLQRSPSPIFHDAREAPKDAPQRIHQSLTTCPTRASLSEFEQEGSASEVLRKLTHQDSQSDNTETE